MKTLYMKIKQLTPVMLLMFVLTGCLSDLSYQEAMMKNERRIDDPEKLDDAKFLVEAKSYSLAETRLAELASTKGYASAIVSLGKEFLKDHDRLEDELASLARREKIKLPKEMNEEHEDYVEDVAKADREDFDKEFLTALKKINEETNERFMAMATDAKDADVRAFSARKLDLLKAHAQKMERVEQDLLNTY